MRKKIFQFLLLATIIIIPVSVDAANQCPSNATPTLQATDPACWTSASSGYWETCKWSYYGSDCCKKQVGNGFYDCAVIAGGCNSSYPIQRRGYGKDIIYYQNSCGGTSCNNPNAGPPSNYNVWVGSTAYTCHYTTVKSWSTCSITTGIRYATALNQLSTSGTSCDNLNESTVQTCGVCTPGTSIDVTKMPTTTGICAFGTATTPVLAANVWTWKCKGSNDSIADDDAACSVPNNADGVCNSTAAVDYAWNATGFTGELCTSGTPTIDKKTSFPGYGQTVTWGCKGIGTGTSTTSSACRATRGTPPPCDCGPADGTTSTNAPSTGLCDVGNASSVSGSTAWQWTCGTQDGAGICTLQAQCSAECINITIDTPQFVYLQESGTTIEARITVQGRSHTNGVSCTLNGQNVTFSGTNDTSDPVTVPVSGAQTTLTAVCEITDPCGGNAGNTRTYTKSQKVQSVCTQRTCSTQGTCQTTPQPASTPDDCTSSCNSDADCSSGRMIETRP